MHHHKLHEAVDRLELNLSGLKILTEAATGAYAVTPVIAALAGAQVRAFTRSTRYGTVDQVREEVMHLAVKAGVKAGQIEIIEDLRPEWISEADVVTNSGHLRPLNREVLQYLKKGAVLPLMFEEWEFRPDDLDLAFCHQRGIQVGATNERHPDVDVFNYLGDMAIRMIFDAGLCLYRNCFVLISNNDFGPYIANRLAQMAPVAVCDLSKRREEYVHRDITWIGEFPHFDIPDAFRDAAAVLFTAFPFTDTWIGDNKTIELKRLTTQLRNPFILRYAGEIDASLCDLAGVPYYPAVVKPGHMGILPSGIGADAIIRLQAGGLKVAELMLRGESNFHGEPLLKYM